MRPKRNGGNGSGPKRREPGNDIEEVSVPRGRGVRPSTLETAERARQAYSMHLAGVRNGDIAERLGIAERTVKAYLQTARAVAAASLGEKTIAEIRALEVERLDAMQVNFYAKAVNGNIAAGYLTLELMRHRAKLLGLEAPAKVDIQHSVAVSPEELNNHIERRIRVIEASTGTEG